MPTPLSEQEIAARKRAPYNGQMRKSRAKQPQPSAAFAGRPRMPKYLSGAARDKWRSLIRFLSQRGVLTPGDGEMLETYCVIYARWRKVTEEIEKDGPIVDCPVTDNAGEVHFTRKESPACKVAGKLEIQLRQLLKELTLTVASRERAKPAKKNPGSDPLPVDSVGWMLQQYEEEQRNAEPNSGNVSSEPEANQPADANPSTCG